MGKMYLSEEEACQTLGVDLDGLMEYVNDGRLQMYQDGAKHVYKAGDVEQLAEQIGATPAEEETNEIEVAPPQDDSMGASVLELEEVGDDTSAGQSLDQAGLEDEPLDVSSGMEEVTLDQADQQDELPESTASPGKDDTVISTAGISIFDDEDLEIEEADPSAATQIAPSLDEDQVALDGVGSGSGLLDLTRESDDTSLGAEVLDHIDTSVGTGLTSGLAGVGSGIGSELSDTALSSGLEDVSATTPTTGPAAAPAAAPAAQYVETTDASSGFFGGLTVGAAITMLVVLAVTISAQQGIIGGLTSTLQANLMIAVGALAVVTIIAGVIGMMLGKALSNQ